jgi:hypothetical protein
MEKKDILTDKIKRETMAHPDRDQEIRLIAYHLWLDEGCPPDRHLDHWYRAESIWREQQAAKPLKQTRTTIAKSKTKAESATGRTKQPAGKPTRARAPIKQKTDGP